MKLYEFTRVDPFTSDESNVISSYWKNNQDFFKYLMTLGWKIRTDNGGVYSSVLINPNTSYVLKINSIYDKGFAWFMLLVRKFPNPHFPKMMDAKLLINDYGKKVYIYKMERLNKIKNPVLESIIQAIDKYVLDVYENHFAKNFEDYRLQIINDSSLIDNNDLKYFLLFEKYIEKHPRLLEALDIIGKYKKGSLDLHRDNFMQRQDGTLVINDPFAGD